MGIFWILNRWGRGVVCSQFLEEKIPCCLRHSLSCIKSYICFSHWNFQFYCAKWITVRSMDYTRGPIQIDWWDGKHAIFYMFRIVAFHVTSRTCTGRGTKGFSQCIRKKGYSRGLFNDLMKRLHGIARIFTTRSMNINSDTWVCCT